MYHIDPRVVFGIAIAGLLYAWASWKLGRRPDSRQIVAFGAGLLVLLFALTGPIDYYVLHRSFSLYIIQQMLLVFIAPPLLLLGFPDWMARAVLTNRWVAPIWRTVTKPLIAFGSFAAVFTLVHYPFLCDKICHVRPPYGDVRDVLLIAGIVLWWPLLSPLPEFPRLSYPFQILYLFMLTIPMTAVAAPITLAHSVLYMFYRSGAHPFGLTPMADQILGGLIMWIGQGVYLMCIFTAVFFRWSRLEDGDIPPVNIRQPPGLRVVENARR
ncbi:MAG: cytochrome c oxidase assembly protein [Candidatus Binataceae bacterium]